MREKGTALIVTLVYLIIVSIICVAALSFSTGHYKLLSQRVDRSQNMYLAEGGLYYGLAQGTGIIYIGSEKVTVSESLGKLESSRNY